MFDLAVEHGEVCLLEMIVCWRVISNSRTHSVNGDCQSTLDYLIYAMRSFPVSLPCFAYLNPARLSFLQTSFSFPHFLETESTIHSFKIV